MGNQIAQIRAKIKDAPRSQRRLFESRLRGAERKSKGGTPSAKVLGVIERDLNDAVAAYETRKNATLDITYPPELPVSERREEITQTIRDNRVVILCGETGSGKTTQLPKICLELGLGRDAMIGHTQPRRIAARTVASRVASELEVRSGTFVGSKMRFGDDTGPETMVKVMTDGILLAETRSDPDLRAYDTIIVDEAHERSLNIDFLLGYLRRLLDRRDDFKLIVTSATLDAQRFSEHFAILGEPAPVIQVEGRTYPVEIRHDAEDTLRGIPISEAAANSAVQLVHEGHADVLVFMPGEREIRQTAHELRKHGAMPDGVDILPLYARLSPQEQQRVFKSDGRPRIVIATNVAETSITVPNIRAVVDPGVARMKRYNARTKLHGLMVEPISQASIAQRAGRCGRVAPGVCVRLFEETDEQGRDEYTQPELLRSSLASVILQMLDLKLGDPESFPFIDTPESRQWRDGYETLHELGAIDDANELTEIGKKMARLPIDPRVSRMILAASDENCVHDVLIIAAALSTQDPRVRPHDKQVQADEAHEQFREDGSDFLSYLRIWDWYHDQHEKLTRRKLARACEKLFLVPRRIDEWREMYRQLRSVCQSIKLDLKPRHTEDTDAIHRALLSGLLTNIGTKGDKHEYKGTRGTEFMLSPGSTVFEDKPKWVVAGEIVRTTKVYARTVAKVDARWIEEAAPHLIKRTYSNPRWDLKTARAIADERVSLYGLDIVPRRTIGFGKVEPQAARELFIHHALVEEEYETRSDAVRANRAFIKEVRRSEAKLRRGDILADTKAIFAFYNARVPEDVMSGKAFERWASRTEVDIRMTESDILHGDAGVDEEAHPDALELAGRDAPLEYRFMPGADDDGVRVDVKVEDLVHLTPESLEWAVPGYIPDRIEALVRSLPKSLRRQFDAPAIAQELAPTLKQGDGSIQSQLAANLSNRCGVLIRPDQFRADQLPLHVLPMVRVLDEKGKELDADRDLRALKSRLQERSKKAAARAASRFEQRMMQSWDLDGFPRVVSSEGKDARGEAFAMMRLTGSGVELTGALSEWVATRESVAAQGYLLMKRLTADLKLRLKQLPGYTPMSVSAAACGYERGVSDALALSRAGMVMAIEEHGVIRTREDFEAIAISSWDDAHGALLDTLSKLGAVFGAISQTQALLSDSYPQSWDPVLKDESRVLASLRDEGLLRTAPTRWVLCVPRMLRASQARLERLRSSGVPKDREMWARVEPWMRCLRELRDQGAHEDDSVASAYEELFWMTHEFRVGVFAQRLGTSVSVSEKKLRAALDKILHG